MKSSVDREYHLKKWPFLFHVMVEGNRETIRKICLQEGEKGPFFLHISSSLQNSTKDLIIAWLEAYAQKKPSSIDLPLDRSVFKTLFQQKVMETLEKIPFGSQISYAQLAAEAGFNRAFRAVGTLMHHNPYPLVIPCHRVVGKKGLGGFAYSLFLKRYLLEHEGNIFSQIVDNK